MTGVAPTSVPESVADYAALPGPGGQRSKLPALDAKRWTLKVALSQRPWSFVASIAMAAAFVCNGLTPVVVGQAVDEAIATSSLQRLGFWILVLAGLYLVAIGVNWIARFMLVRSQQLVSHDLRTMVTDRIQDPRGFAGRERTPGGLLLIASADTQRVGEIVMMTVMPVAEAASITYGAIVMYTINPWLSLATLVGGPLLVIVALRVGRPLQRRSIARQQSVAQAAATAADVVQGLRILKGLGAIITVRGRYDEESGTAYARTVEANAAEARLNGVTDATGAIFVSSLGIAAGVLALHGVVTIGQLITVVGLTQFLITPMTMLGRNLASRWASAEASGQRIRDVLGAGFERSGEVDAARTSPLHRRAAHRPHRRPRCRTTSWSSRLESLPRTRVIVAPHAADLFDGSCRRQRVPRSGHRRAGSPGRLLRRHPRGFRTSAWAKVDACSPAVSASGCHWPAPSRSTPKSSSSRIRPRRWTR